jgi:hypothetical protein
MDKPLKDWTLGETKEYCRGRKCTPERCLFVNKFGPCGRIKSIPSQWDLAEPPRFTEQEREDAKTILRMFKNYTIVERNGCDLLLKVSEYYPFAVALVSSMFPSVQECETVSLKEIAGCEDG